MYLLGSHVSSLFRSLLLFRYTHAHMHNHRQIIIYIYSFIRIVIYWYIHAVLHWACTVQCAHIILQVLSPWGRFKLLILLMLGYLPQFMYPLTIIQSSIQLGLPLIVFPSILPFMMDLKRDLSLSLLVCVLCLSLIVAIRDLFSSTFLMQRYLSFVLCSVQITFSVLH